MPKTMIGVFRNWLRVVTPEWEYTERIGEPEPTARFARTLPRRIHHPGKPAQI